MHFISDGSETLSQVFSYGGTERSNSRSFGALGGVCHGWPGNGFESWCYFYYWAFRTSRTFPHTWLVQSMADVQELQLGTCATFLWEKLYCKWISLLRRHSWHAPSKFVHLLALSQSLLVFSKAKNTNVFHCYACINFFSDNVALVQQFWHLQRGIMHCWKQTQSTGVIGRSAPLK